jgi:hypothetical protein
MRRRRVESKETIHTYHIVIAAERVESRDHLDQMDEYRRRMG